MVELALGESTHPVGKRQRAREVGELELLLELVVVDNRPSRFEQRR